MAELTSSTTMTMTQANRTKAPVKKSRPLNGTTSYSKIKTKTSCCRAISVRNAAAMPSSEYLVAPKICVNHFMSRRRKVKRFRNTRRRGGALLPCALPTLIRALCQA